MNDPTTSLTLDVEATQQALGPSLALLVRTGTSHQGIVMALSLMMAHHAWHDGASLEDLIACVTQAWERTRTTHATKDCSGATDKGSST